MWRVFAVTRARRQPQGRFAACRAALSCYRSAMADGSPPDEAPPTHPAATGADRIDRALERIEAALAARTGAGDSLAERHAVLRAQMARAIADIDAIVEQGGE